MIPDTLEPHIDAARVYGDVARRRIASHPVAITAALATGFLAYAARRVFDPLPDGTWPELADSVIFEYVGWYLSRGNRLYVDVWEVKPPLSFEVTAVLALLAGDDVVLYHVLNLLANGTAVVLGAAAAAGIVHELTDDPLGAVVAGLATFTMPYYFYRALVGFKAKYFVVAAGLGCLYLAYRERPAAAGAAGAAAVGFWQLAVVFPLAALGVCWQADGRAGARRFLAAAAVTGAVVLLPVVLWGALPAMVAEVLLAPLLTAEGHAFGDRVQIVVLSLRRALPVAIVGLIGIAGGLRPGRFEREWPLVLAAGWFTVQLVALDFDQRPDLFPWFAVVSVGVGLAVASTPRAPRASVGGDERSDAVPRSGSRAVAVAILLIATLSVATMGGYGTGNTGLTDPDTYDTGTELEPEFASARTYNATERQYVYWNRVELPTCRALGGYDQARLVNRLGLAEDGPWYEAPCGQFEPAWRAVLREYVGSVGPRDAGRTSQSTPSN